MPKAISTQIRIDNVSNITYVLKKFPNKQFKLFTYKRNMSSGCYSGSVNKGTCQKTTYYF
jgi:hypothetical protein